MDRVSRARCFAELAHTGQVYNEEVPYSVHLQQVVDVLKRFGVADDNLYCAGYLHDSIEDTRTSYSDIEKRFGTEVAELVFAVTNEQGRNRKERAAKTYPKIVAAGAQATILKLADRIANVEYGLADGIGKSDMYRKEFPEFATALYNQRAVKDVFVAARLENMWRHLARLLNCAELIETISKLHT